MEAHVSDITRVIQLAVAPVFLLTALATLINGMNSRLGRIIDRRRIVMDRLRSIAADESGEPQEELALLARRGRLIYSAIFFAVLSSLMVCFVVAAAFVGALLAVDLARTVAGLFVVAMMCMIVGLALFLREVYLGVRTGTHTRR